MTERLRLLRAAWIWFVPVVVLAAALAFSLWAGPSAPQWPAPATRPASAVAPAASAAPGRAALSQYAAVWQSPLFVSTRQADATRQVEAEAPPAPPLGNVVLTGVVLAGEVRIAMLKAPGNQGGAFHEGQTLPNGWTLARVEARKIELRYGTAQQTLELVTPRLPMTLP